MDQPRRPLSPRLVHQPEMSVPAHSRRWRVVMILACAVLLIGLALFFGFHNVNRSRPANTSGQRSAQAHPDTIRLIATGDFIAHDTLNDRAKKADGSYDYLQFMSDFTDIFKRSDIRFCNQATVSAGEAFGISGYPVFNAPTQFAQDMAHLGCNLINTASNHSFDKGQPAIDATLQTWQTIPNLLAVAGENRTPAEQQTIRYFSVRGIKMAFLAYTTYSNTTPPNNYGVNQYSEALARQQIQAAKSNGAKLVIVSLRWGTEYATTETAGQSRIGQFLADQGVQVVLGHGPHVLQPVQRFKGAGGNETIVWYSLGNFLNTQEGSEPLFNGLAVLDFDVKSLQLNAVHYLPIYMHYEWSAAQQKADDVLSRHNLHLYLLENATQSMLDQNQLSTTIEAQRQRLSQTLNTYTAISLWNSNQYYQ